MMIEGCKKLSDGTIVCFPVETKVESKKEKVYLERPRQAQRPERRGKRWSSYRYIYRRHS